MPIIGSLLNNDWYKFTMPPVARRYYRDTVTGSCFINRDPNFRIADYFDIVELREELAALRTLRYTKQELDYLRSLGAISPAYLEHLKNFHMPEVHAETHDGQLIMEAQGIWDDIMPVEVPALQIITELISRAIAKEIGLSPADIRREGYRQLDKLVALMKANPSKRIVLFGTRRHFSVAWEYEATAYLVYKIPNQIAGISNVGLAREFGYPVGGTIAHEYFIIPTMIEVARGTENPIGVAQNQAMDHWEEEYADIWDGAILCAVPDTFGTDAFLDAFTPDRAKLWRVFKQDSGMPQIFVNKLMHWLQEHDLDTSLYRVNHTDGLDVASMAELFRFADKHPARYMDGYGVGTRTSNNVGVPTFSLVWKPSWVMVDGEKVPAVKLSDNLSKATGDPAMVARVKKLAGYTNTFRQTQTV